MKTLMKTMIVLGLILFSFRMIVGCKGKQESQQKNNQNTLAGRYHNQDDFEEYIEIKGDGTAYWREKSSFGSHYTELAAKWKTDGEEIVFVGPLEVVVRGKITGDTILADGKVWIRKGEIKNTSKKNPKDDIPAKFKPKTFYDTADRDRQFLEQPSTEQGKAITIVPDSTVTVVPDEGNEGPSHITSEQPTTEQAKAITTVPDSTATVVPDETKKSKVAITRERLRLLHNAINQFRMDTGRWPTKDEGLAVLIKQPKDVRNWPPGGYLDPAEIPKDAWGNDFIYESRPISGKPFVIKSLGADAQEGGQGNDGDLLSTD